MIPNWLTPWWNWWASFTGLFQWEAIDAIGTVGALIAAISLADAGNRAQRRRQAAILVGLSHAFGTASQLLASSFQMIKAGMLARVAIESIVATSGIQTQLMIVNSVNLIDFPSVKVLAGYNGGRAILTTILDDMQRAVGEEGVRLATIPAERDAAPSKLSVLADLLDCEARRIVWPWPIQ